MKNECITCSNCHIEVTLGTSAAYDKAVPHAKHNLKISTDVIDNGVVVLKFECFHQKALILKKL